MDTKLKRIKKINPNEYGGLLYDHEELDAVLHVLLKGKIFRYSSRKLSVVDKFENKIKKYLKIKYALGLNNGTSALRTALVALGVKPQDRVLISSYTFIATAAAVISVGAVPVPIDLDMNFGMNIDNLESEINKGCAAVIPVHIQGRAFDVRHIVQLAKRHNVPVIEDACQAFGAKCNGIHAGCLGDIGVYSFQQYKQISSGEGGLLVTSNEQYYRKAKIYSDHGVVRDVMSWDTAEAMIGDNLRMNNLQAAIMGIQVKKMGKLMNLQKKNRNFVINHIDATKSKSLVNSSDVSGETGMNIMLLASSKEIAAEIIAHAKNKKIEFRRLWDKPYYLHGVFKKYKLTPQDLNVPRCTVAEDVSQRLLSVSIPPTLSSEQLKKIYMEIRSLQKLDYFN